MVNYEKCMEEYNSLKSESQLIMIDQSKKLKLRGVYPYGCLQLVTGIISWLFWKRVPVHDVEGDFCYIDSSFTRDLAYILCKNRMEYNHIDAGKINNSLIECLEPHLCAKLLQFMIQRLKKSKNQRAIQVLNELRECEEALNKDENDRASIKQIIEYFMIDEDKLFCGPIAIVRGLKDVLVSSFVEPIVDPLTANIRKDLEELSFENGRVGGMTYFDTDNMYIIEVDDVLRMHYPFDEHFQFAEITECDRHNSNKDDVPEVKLLASGKLNVNVDDVDSEWKEEDLCWKVVLENHVKRNNLFVSYKPGRAMFDAVDGILLDICKTSDFINFWKGKDIEVWSGHDDINKIADMRELRKERDRLQKDNDELRRKLKSKK